MKEICCTLFIIMTMVLIMDTAHLPMTGLIILDLSLKIMQIYPLENFDPLVNENQSRTDIDIYKNESQPTFNLPLFDPLHDHVHRSLEINNIISIFNNTILEKAGPSLDIIDSHAHKNNDSNVSTVESKKHFLVQPSIDLLDAQLHDGEDQIHSKNRTYTDAADLSDFYRWLKEQNETNQLDRFLLLQKEMHRFHSVNTKSVNDKLNRTIEELKTTVKGQQRAEHEL